jgi:hypothetical protein
MAMKTNSERGKRTRTILILTFVITCILALSALVGCGGASGLSVNEDGEYSFAKVKNAKFYVIQFYDAEAGVISEDASPVLKQTIKAEEGTSGTFKKVVNLPFGTYVPTVYGIMADKTNTDVVEGEQFIKGGKLSKPEIVVQRDYGSAKVSITDKCFDDIYFVTETVYSFTIEVFTDKSCSGTPIATQTFGSDVEYIDPTNSSKPIWIRNRSVDIPLEDGTYYIRCKANGNDEDAVEDSDYSEVSEISISSGETDVKYCTGTFDPKTGVLTMTSDTLLEFGNGASMFTEFSLVNDAETVKEGDLYTLNGDANCDMHLVGEAGATTGEAYTCGPRLMPIDKPDIRGEWKVNDDGTITVTLMDDYQYYIDEADKKTT